MKALMFAAVLSGAAPNGLETGSLGIGIDVLPEAFSFAASRSGYAPTLRLTHCDSTQCSWHLGDGIEMTARLSQTILDVGRVEVRLESPASSAAVEDYRRACIAIVALFEPEADSDRRDVIAAAIASPASDVVIGGSVRFFGASRRCGAAALPAASREQP